MSSETAKAPSKIPVTLRIPAMIEFLYDESQTPQLKFPLTGNVSVPIDLIKNLINRLGVAFNNTLMKMSGCVAYIICSTQIT